MKAGFNLVRWMLVVTLGCSLGLLFIFIIVSLRPVRDDVGGNIYVRNRVQSRAPDFNVSEDEVEKELTDVIEAQLSAFRQDDYPKAYLYAAAGVKAQMSLPAFERMVRRAYPLIAQSRSAQFGVILDNGEQAVVSVAIVGGSGRTRHYQYLLLRESVGWKIGAVTEVKPTGTTI